MLDEQAQPHQMHSDRLDALPAWPAGMLYGVRVDRKSVSFKELRVRIFTRQNTTESGPTTWRGLHVFVDGTLYCRKCTPAPNACFDVHANTLRFSLTNVRDFPVAVRHRGAKIGLRVQSHGEGKSHAQRYLPPCCRATRHDSYCVVISE